MDRNVIGRKKAGIRLAAGVRPTSHARWMRVRPTDANGTRLGRTGTATGRYEGGGIERKVVLRRTAGPDFDGHGSLNAKFGGFASAVVTNGTHQQPSAFHRLGRRDLIAQLRQNPILKFNGKLTRYRAR
jgi:hypothetical protein